MDMSARLVPRRLVELPAGVKPLAGLDPESRGCECLTQALDGEKLLVIIGAGTDAAGFDMADIIRVRVMPVRHRDPDGSARLQVTERVLQDRRNQVRRNMLEHMLRKQPVNLSRLAKKRRPGFRSRCIEETDIRAKPVRRRRRPAKHDFQRQPRRHGPPQPAFLKPVPQGSPDMLEEFSAKTHGTTDCERTKSRDPARYTTGQRSDRLIASASAIT